MPVADAEVEATGLDRPVEVRRRGVGQERNRRATGEDMK